MHKHQGLSNATAENEVIPDIVLLILIMQINTSSHLNWLTQIMVCIKHPVHIPKLFLKLLR